MLLGGAVLVENIAGSFSVFSRNTFTDNRATLFGGAVSVALVPNTALDPDIATTIQNNTIIFRDNVVVSNSAQFGGGVAVLFTGTINTSGNTNSFFGDTFSNNIATQGYGGGLLITFPADAPYVPEDASSFAVQPRAWTYRYNTNLFQGVNFSHNEAACSSCSGGGTLDRQRSHCTEGLLLHSEQCKGIWRGTLHRRPVNSSNNRQHLFCTQLCWIGWSCLVLFCSGRPLPHRSLLPPVGWRGATFLLSTTGRPRGRPHWSGCALLSGQHVR